MSEEVSWIFVNGDATRPAQRGLFPAATQQANRLEIGSGRSLSVIGRVADDDDFVRDLFAATVGEQPRIYPDRAWTWQHPRMKFHFQ